MEKEFCIVLLGQIIHILILAVCINDVSKIVLYEYQLGRKGEYPKEFLEGFSGYLYCDGYIIAIYAGQQRFARRHRGINAME